MCNVAGISEVCVCVYVCVSADVGAMLSACISISV